MSTLRPDRIVVGHQLVEGGLERGSRRLGQMQVDSRGDVVDVPEWSCVIMRVRLSHGKAKVGFAAFGVSGLLDGLPVATPARYAALITHGAPGQTCRPLMSPRRSIRGAVILHTPT